MNRKTSPAPLVTARPPKKAGLLRKAARIGATLVATRVAASTGKKGVVGLLAGMGAKRVIMRYPAGALLVSGAYLVGKLFETKQEIDRKKAIKLLSDQSERPIQLDDARARKARIKR